MSIPCGKAHFDFDYGCEFCEIARLEVLLDGEKALSKRYRERATEAEATVAVLVEALQNHNLRMGQAGPILDLIADLPAETLRYQREHELQAKVVEAANSYVTVVGEFPDAPAAASEYFDALNDALVAFAKLEAFATLKETP